MHNSSIMANNWNEDVSKPRQMSETVLTQGVRKTVVNELYGKIQYVPYIRENIFNAGDDLLVRLEPEDKQRRFQRMRHSPTHKSQHIDVLQKGNENSKSSVNPSYNKSILLLQDVADYIQPNRRPEEAPTDNQLRNILTRNPVLSEICEIPLFALMLAHMSNKNVEPFASLTSFFKSTLMKASENIIKYIKKREGGNYFAAVCSIEQVNKIDYVVDLVKTFCSDGMVIKTTDGTLQQKSQIQLLRYCLTSKDSVKPGIFVGTLFEDCSLPQTFNNNQLTPSIKSWNVPVLWNSFRYSFQLDLACGLWKVAVPLVINLSKCKIETGKIRMKTGLVLPSLLSVEKILVKVNERKVTEEEILGISSYGQRCRLLKEIRLRNTFTIAMPCLVLDPSNCKYENDTIRLESGVRLASIPSLQKILIQADGRDLTTEDVIGIASYGQHCDAMKELRLFAASSIDPKKITQRLRSWKVQVNWRPSDQGFLLNLQSGEWRSIVQLLHIAAKRNISISCLHLYRSFVGICDENIISLNSNIRLSCPSSVQMIGINTEEEGRELTETEFVRVLLFAQKSERLNELWFGDCLLPMSIPAASVPIKLKLKNVKVLWNPRDAFLQYNLDLESGRG
ncbi:hypothetical protein BSL78_00145 [Apostichopus japonicus]|uniref:Uncharacterized protein n=1 Tax=Stichopus japonicus TaxID=307972 RepID=A0A2G8LRW0_STIJA|nr:hypothetical protein BSL78_00145 [Apostichopus japonicus]